MPCRSSGRLVNCPRFQHNQFTPAYPVDLCSTFEGVVGMSWRFNLAAALQGSEGGRGEGSKAVHCSVVQRSAVQGEVFSCSAPPASLLWSPELQLYRCSSKLLIAKGRTWQHLLWKLDFGESFHTGNFVVLCWKTGVSQYCPRAANSCHLSKHALLVLSHCHIIVTYALVYALVSEHVLQITSVSCVLK